MSFFLSFSLSLALSLSLSVSLSLPPFFPLSLITSLHLFACNVKHNLAGSSNVTRYSSSSLHCRPSSVADLWHLHQLVRIPAMRMGSMKLPKPWGPNIDPIYSRAPIARTQTKKTPICRNSRIGSHSCNLLCGQAARVNFAGVRHSAVTAGRSAGSC